MSSEALHSGEPTRAGRALAGKTCPACSSEILLGEEVVTCSRCGDASHSRCWSEKNGCTSAACARTVEVAAEAAQTRACPACAEQIPEDSVVCPYCAEPLSGNAEAGGVPDTFTARSGFLMTRKWTFTIRGDELVGVTARGRKSVRLLRTDPTQRLVLNKKKLILFIDGRKHRFFVDDLGHVAVDHWVSGVVTPHTSILATEALTTAIISLFLFQLILGPVAIIKSCQARRLIRRYPHLLQGKGQATAGLIVSIVSTAGSWLVLSMAIIGASVGR